MIVTVILMIIGKEDSQVRSRGRIFAPLYHCHHHNHRRHHRHHRHHRHCDHWKRGFTGQKQGEKLGTPGCPRHPSSFLSSSSSSSPSALALVSVYIIIILLIVTSACHHCHLNHQKSTDVIEYQAHRTNKLTTDSLFSITARNTPCVLNRGSCRSVLRCFVYSFYSAQNVYTI